MADRDEDHAFVEGRPIVVDDAMIARFRYAWFMYPAYRGMNTFDERARAALTVALTTEGRL